MLILDNSKDYYDYIQGVYGVDRKIVFNRHAFNLQHEDVRFSCHDNLAYFLVEVATTWYLIRVDVDPERDSLRGEHPFQRLSFYHKDIRSLSLICTKEIDEKEKLSDSVSFLLNIDNAHTVFSMFVSYMITHGRKYGFGNERIDYDDMFRCLFEMPVSEIVPKVARFGFESYFHCKNPLLKCINFGGIVPPEEIFIKIQNFLSSQIKDGVEVKLTDEQKIVGHGFDKKTSFRKVK